MVTSCSSSCSVVVVIDLQLAATPTRLDPKLLLLVQSGRRLFAATDGVVVSNAGVKSGDGESCGNPGDDKADDKENNIPDCGGAGRKRRSDMKRGRNSSSLGLYRLWYR